MSLTNSPIWFGSGATGGGFYDYEINESLRGNEADSPYLNRTPSSASNRKTYTISAWIKPSLEVATFSILGAGSSGSAYYVFGIEGNDLYFEETSGGGSLRANRKLRDPSAWYHLVAAVDSTQATASNRIKLYVNGVQETSFSSATYMSQNRDSSYINNTSVHYIGHSPVQGSHYLNGYITEVNFIDGTALAPTSFGETKDGVWIPKEYSGSYGTNGFYLDFSDNSTATALGTDSSGNSNNFSVNGIATTDQMIDTPTNNFAVMSFIHPSSSNFTISDGNLSVAKSGTGTFGLYSQSLMPTTGKWYFEACITGRGSSDRTRVGIANYNSVTGTSTIQSSYSGVEISTAAADKIFIVENGTTTENDTFYTALSDNDVVRFAVDMDNGRLYIGVNGNWWDYNTAETGGDPTSGSGYVTNSTTIFDGSPMTAYSGFSAGLTTSTGQTFNFGQDSTFSGAVSAGGNSDANGNGDFKYSVPSGYLALCTSNLPEPVVGPLGDSLSSDNFNTVLYTGNGSTQSITGVGFQPDWVWLKSRTGVYDHTVYDVVRGATYKLPPNDTYAESADIDTLTSFDSDGFSLGDDLKVNASSGSMVSWNWKAGGTAVSNTAGSITSQVSANVDAGFSIVSYTGTGANATVGHSLGVQPSMIIVRVRSTTNNWAVYHSSLGNTKALLLDTTDAGLTSSLFWNNTTPTSSVFSISTGNSVNNSGQTYIAYCFANIDGYSKVGSYTGNGSADGTFVYTGFRPAWVMMKYSSTSSYWIVFDNKRNVYNLTDKGLRPNEASDENTNLFFVDFLSNGFKARDGGGLNGNGNTGIYLAFAENPFKYANAR